LWIAHRLQASSGTVKVISLARPTCISKGSVTEQNTAFTSEKCFSEQTRRLIMNVYARGIVGYFMVLCHLHKLLNIEGS
jgi:hypothetical protein